MYIEIYLVHGVRDIEALGDSTQRWAEKAEADGKINFSASVSIAKWRRQLSRASKLECFDGIMYDPEMKVAVEGCIQAGMDLTAMANQAERSWFKSSVAEKPAPG